MVHILLIFLNTNSQIRIQFPQILLRLFILLLTLQVLRIRYIKLELQGKLSRILYNHFLIHIFIYLLQTKINHLLLQQLRLRQIHLHLNLKILNYRSVYRNICHQVILLLTVKLLLLLVLRIIII